MAAFLGDQYFTVKKSGTSQAEVFAAYMFGSAFQTVVDNPVTAYRQMVQQYSKDLSGKIVDPKIARQEANAVFKTNPVSASLSGLVPRLIGVGFKRIPKFGCLLGIQYIFLDGGDVGLVAATGASILSAPFINPVRMIEKQQRAYFKQMGTAKPIVDILKESAAKNYRPLFRGTVPLMGHSLASATTGLVGQPQLKKFFQKELGQHTNFGSFTIGLCASALVSPVYVFMTNPLSRLEVIMQTSAVNEKKITLPAALKEVAVDIKEFGVRGMFRGQGLGIAKAIISLTMFHEGRLWAVEKFKQRNIKNGLVPL